MYIMALTSQNISLFTILLFFCLTHMSSSNPLSDDSHHPKTFIVHMEKSQKPSVFSSHHQWYNSIIKSLPPSRHPSKIVYTYEKVVNGFAASLTLSQAEKLKDIPGILSVLPDETHELEITHTYRFLELSLDSGIWILSNLGDDIIIGVLDTGIWPEHRSFSDAGLSPVPTTWRGFCEYSSDFPASSCNRKLIGARAFTSGYYLSDLGRYSLNQTATTKSPRDTNGHGTHVASTAAGAAVTKASFRGYANGVAIGVAPNARISVYKVCATHSCLQSDMLAGMDQAVADGVDIISMSISGGTGPYYRDNMAIGTYGATQQGILVSVAGGNAGPKPSTVNHLPPWVLTVAASSVNREFRADVILGDGRTFLGSSLYAGPFFSFSDRYQLVYAGDFGNRFCSPGKFKNQRQLAGKIVVCDGGDVGGLVQGRAVQNVGGRGTIVANGVDFGEELRAEPHTVPAARVGITDGNKIKRYIKSSQKPTGNILFRGKSVIGYSPPAPKVATFSSRGPNPLTPQILKPDVIAPGLNILAAWTQAGGAGSVEFNIISGTSMACPHVSGIAALLRKAHPRWSPAAIKSAIMTTAYTLDNSGQSIKDLATGNESTPFVHGVGHVDPSRALDPGLVYDIGVYDYVGFLCSIGYNYQQIGIVLRAKFMPNICDEAYTIIGGRVTPSDLNLPSMTVVFNNEVETVKYRRTVTNVGSNVDATYVASWSAPAGIEIDISPNRLVFSAKTQTLTYRIKISSLGGYGKYARFGWIEWSDGRHRVRSTTAFSWVGSAIESVASI